MFEVVDACKLKNVEFLHGKGKLLICYECYKQVGIAFRLTWLDAKGHEVCFTFCKDCAMKYLGNLDVRKTIDLELAEYIL